MLLPALFDFRGKNSHDAGRNETNVGWTSTPGRLYNVNTWGERGAKDIAKIVYSIYNTHRYR